MEEQRADLNMVSWVGRKNTAEMLGCLVLCPLGEGWESVLKAYRKSQSEDARSIKCFDF